MSKRIATLCAAGGPAAVIVALGGWLLAGVLPLPLGADSAVPEVVAFYADGSGRVRAGLVIASIGVCLVFPLIALIGVRMLRLEGRGPILTFLQLTTGAATGVLLLIPMLIMAVAAFRSDRPPELTVLLNDLAWLLFLTPIAPFMIQDVAIAIAVLSRADDDTGLPRWIGYFNLWIPFLFIPDVLAYFFYRGPFAWQGIFVFWLALAAYAAWLIVMGLVLRRDAAGGDSGRAAESVKPTEGAIAS